MALTSVGDWKKEVYEEAKKDIKVALESIPAHSPTGFPVKAFKYLLWNPGGSPPEYGLLDLIVKTVCHKVIERAHKELTDNAEIEAAKTLVTIDQLIAVVDTKGSPPSPEHTGVALGKCKGLKTCIK